MYITHQNYIYCVALKYLFLRNLKDVDFKSNLDVDDL